MKRTATSILCVTCVVFVSGCSSMGQSSEAPETSRDVAEMKERILELQEKAAMAEVELARLRQQVIQLEARLEAEPIETKPDPLPAVELAVPETSPSSPMRAADPIVEESDLEIEPPETAAGGEVEQSRESPPAGEPSILQPVEPAAQALYDRGYTLYHQGRYVDAEASFQRYLQAYPSTDLSDNAQFWIGESRYARGDIRGALAAFRETLQRFPEGNKVPDALIKEGDCLASLGDKDGSRARYQEVMRRFPDAAAAVVAEERLAGMD